MTKGITEKEPDPRIVYADIIDLPHHQSATRPHMSLYDRAAQFAPFAALSGYDEMIVEEARETDTGIVLEDWELEQLNQKLTLIADVLEDGNGTPLSPLSRIILGLKILDSFCNASCSDILRRYPFMQLTTVKLICSVSLFLTGSIFSFAFSGASIKPNR